MIPRKENDTKVIFPIENAEKKMFHYISSL